MLSEIVQKKRKIRRKRVWLILLASLLFLVAIGTTGLYQKSRKYLSNDPTACIDCHVMKPHYEQWVLSAHGAFASGENKPIAPRAVCNDCHAPAEPELADRYKVKAGMRHSWKYLWKSYKEPIVLKSDGLTITEKNCVRCHSEMEEHIEEARKNNESCMSCHTEMGHKK